MDWLYELRIMDNRDEETMGGDGKNPLWISEIRMTPGDLMILNIAQIKYPDNWNLDFGFRRLYSCPIQTSLNAHGPQIQTLKNVPVSALPEKNMVFRI